MPTSSVVSQGDLAVADHINNVRTDVLSTHTHDGTDGNATIEATSFTGTATYTGASLTFGDEDLLRWGTNADIVSLNRSTALSADTELTGIIEGTSDHPGVAANSLIISNITDDGDIMFAISDGGNSKGMLKLDGANGKVVFHGTTLSINGTDLASTATELNILDGDTSASSVTLADADRIVVNDNGTMKQVALTAFETYFESVLDTLTVTSVGALDSGSITSGFGTIDTGSSTITTTGLITGGSLDIDDVLINGTTIGHTNDTDLMTVADGVLTIAGELDATTLDISSSADIAGDLVLSGGADGALQFTNAGENSIKIPDNQSSALIIEEANNAYITFNTTNSSEAITVAKATTFSAGVTSTAASNTLGATSFNDADITNVGDIALDSISSDGTDINIAVDDNSATALTIKQGSDAYLIIDTANSSESVSIGTGISGTAITIGHGTSETTVADNLTITGDLTVSGTTTTVNSSTLTIGDSLIKLGQAYTGSAYDQGIIFTRGDGSSSNTQNRAVLWDESADEFVFANTNTEAGTTTGNVTLNDLANLHVGGITIDDSVDIEGNIDVNGTTNLDAVDIDGAVQIDSTITVGANDQGYDIIFYGDTASANVTWDTSVDDLILNGAARIVVPDGQLVLGSTAVSSTAAELNLLDGVSGLVQADLTKLAAVDATAAEIDMLDAISRGSIIYGNASGATAILTKGGADTVLTSDGTDISWAAASSGVSLGLVIALS
tara:strand:+ start:871 stop:3066 length:2196 start_codon:yes stop_codon:yes gene_type:complete